MKSKELYAPGTRVVFHFRWYGVTNKRDGHVCEVVSSEVKRLGKNNRKFHKYVLRDTTDGVQFKVTDSSMFGTTLTKTRRTK